MLAVGTSGSFIGESLDRKLDPHINAQHLVHALNIFFIDIVFLHFQPYDLLIFHSLNLQTCIQEEMKIQLLNKYV